MIEIVETLKWCSRKDDLKLAPTMAANDASLFGLPADSAWSVAVHAQAVDYTKSLGMQFSTVDLGMKQGSAWWLYDEEYVDDVYYLKCIIHLNACNTQTSV
ncbi:hypothetical protein F0562_000416 [Nyssa sinensis]|uniref:Uncharacterized protein n=1 Tax=Nyssa sinensis TaxID=561372 RepID=A0A5J5C497_9ASTE|nr:hypothetical protein F0562_000416 [Nyssa sinensis]